MPIDNLSPKETCVPSGVLWACPFCGATPVEDQMDRYIRHKADCYLTAFNPGRVDYFPVYRDDLKLKWNRRANQ
jgi:hypothetical protein